MTTQIVRIGNTLTVEIPEELAVQAELAPGEPVEWVPNGSGSIALVKSCGQSSTQPPTRWTLEELLEGLQDGDSLGEYEWGPPRGAEVW